MAHNIETMFYNREVPWHGLGTRLENPPTSEEALVAAGLDWKVIQKPIYTTNDGVSTPISGYRANIRDTDNKVLGIVTDKYKIVQNVEAFEFVDNLLGEGVRFETAGSLLGGQKVWLLAILPNKYKAIDDVIAPYLCFTNSHDGSGAIRVVLTPTRVVCNNTLNIALKNAHRSWSCVHKGNIQAKLEEARKTLVLAENYMEKFCMEAERLHSKMLHKNDIEAFIEDLFPLPEESGEIKEKNILSLRDNLYSRFYYAPDLKWLENTPWKMMLAVSDFVCHNPPLRVSETYQENNFNRILSGHALMDQAYDILKDFA